MDVQVIKSGKIISNTKNFLKNIVLGAIRMERPPVPRQSVAMRGKEDLDTGATPELYSYMDVHSKV